MMRTHNVVKVLTRRIAWLGAKMQSFNEKNEAYHLLAQEKAATEYARDLVQKEADFQQRLRLEERFSSRDSRYYEEFIAGHCK